MWPNVADEPPDTLDSDDSETQCPGGSSRLVCRRTEVRATNRSASRPMGAARVARRRGRSRHGVPGRDGRLYLARWRTRRGSSATFAVARFHSLGNGKHRGSGKARQRRPACNGNVIAPLPAAAKLGHSVITLSLEQTDQTLPLSSASHRTVRKNRCPALPCRP